MPNSTFSMPWNIFITKNPLCIVNLVQIYLHALIYWFIFYSLNIFNDSSILADHFSHFLMNLDILYIYPSSFLTPVSKLFKSFFLISIKTKSYISSFLIIMDANRKYAYSIVFNLTNKFSLSYELSPQVTFKIVGLIFVSSS